MSAMRPVDVVIVGAGWTGLTMAKELATRTGLSVLALERGGPRRTRDYFDDMDELDYAIRLRLMQDIAQETVTFRHTPRDRALPDEPRACYRRARLARVLSARACGSAAA